MINYTESFNFKPIASITPASDYWQNGTWKFNMPEITVGTAPQPSWRDVILSGNTALTLVNAKEDGLNYLTLFGGTELLPEQYLDTVTLSGGCEQRNLPVGHQQIESLTSDGNAYIDTGFKPTSKTKIDITFSASTAQHFLFGSRKSTTGDDQQRFVMYLSSASQAVRLNPQFANSNYAGVTQTLSVNTKYNIVMDSNGVWLDGTLVQAFTSDTFTGEYNLVLFGNNTAGTVTTAENTIYPTKIYEDGVLVRYYIPDNYNGTLGMYDLVNNVFYPNAGTGTFTAGPDVTTPSPDYPMDIISNNGVIKVNTNLYWTEYNGQQLSQVNGVTLGENASVNVSGMVDCRTIKSFMITTANPAGSYRLFKYDSSKSFIDANTTGNIGDVVTLDSTVGYFRIQYNFSSGNVGTENILIYNSAYPYGIYTDGTQEVVTDSLGNTASAERLLAVGDYKDTQEVLNGSVTRNVGIKVLDGTEDWTFVTGSSAPYSLVISDFDTNAPSASVNVISTHLQGIANSASWQSYDNKITSAYNAIRIGISAITTLADFKQWLSNQYNSGQPVIIVYPLATATTETVQGQFLSKSPVTQIAGSISNLPIAITESSHTTPTPQQPLQINCNNGVVKVRHQSGLPWGYTLLDYIESTGTQYIDTGYKPNTNTAISIKYYPAVSSTFMCLYGTQDATRSNRFYGLISSTQFRVQVNSNAGDTPNFWGINNDGTLSVDTNGTFAQTQGVVTLGIDNKNKVISVKSDEYTGDISASDTVLGDDLNCSYNLLLFSRGTAGTAGNNFSGRIYGFSIKDNENLIQNLIPARRNSDNVIGMYDLVSQTFFTNAGTGDFTAGSPVSDPVEIYADGTVETVQVTGKNLFNPNQEFELGYIDDNGNLVTLSSLKTTTGYIKVSPSTTYNISYIAEQVSISNFNISLWTDDDTFISRVARHNIQNLGVYSANFTTTSTTAKIKVTIWSDDGIYKDFQLEQGSTATTYEPYFNGGQATAEMLLKVGTYQDEQEVLAGNVTRNVGIKVLDGTEGWVQYSASNKVYTFADASTISHPQNAQCLCSHFVTTSGIPGGNHDINKLYLHPTVARVYICFPDIVGDVPAFKQYLADQYNAGTPVIVVYPLATATTESVTGQPLTIQEGTNIVEITQASMDNLELEVSYKAGVAVTITEVENAQLDNNVEVTIQ